MSLVCDGHVNNHVNASSDHVNDHVNDHATHNVVFGCSIDIGSCADWEELIPLWKICLCYEGGE